MTTDLTVRAAFFRALSHPARLTLLRLTWNEALGGEKLAALTGLASATVSHHLAQLSEAGLMTARQDGHQRLHRANSTALNATLAELIGGEVPLPAADDPYRVRVLRAFIKDGKLTRIPAQRKKRDVVLQELAGLFEPGRLYPEQQVNAVLGEWHADFFTLRRELVGLDLLARKDGVYWRVEGTPEAASP